MKLIKYIPFITGALAVSKKVIVGYYAPWDELPVSKIPYTKLTHLNYAFGLLVDHSKPYDIQFENDDEVTKLGEINKLAKRHSVKVLLSLGGWTGGQTFSDIVKDTNHTEKFINNILNFVSDEPQGLGLAGIDLDWEYPNNDALKCNKKDPRDTKNYLSFLKKLRKVFDSKFGKNRKLITAATYVKPFNGQDGEPMSDVSEFGKVFDFINIMAYDMFGGWSETSGANAAFRQDPIRPEHNSYISAISNWIDAGFPSNKINAGLGFYGCSIITEPSKLNFYMKNAKKYPKGDPLDSNEPGKLCDEGSNYSGILRYRYIAPLLQNKTSGYTRYWNEATLTPWLFNPTTRHFISYDDPQSLTIKRDYIRCHDLLGVMVWELSQDYRSQLINTIQPLHQPIHPKVCQQYQTNKKYSKPTYTQPSKSSYYKPGQYN